MLFRKAYQTQHLQIATHLVLEDDFYRRKAVRNFEHPDSQQIMRYPKVQFALF